MRCNVTVRFWPAVLDYNNTILWSTAATTANKGAAPRRMVVQDNGNVVIRDKANTVLWATNTAGR